MHDARRPFFVVDIFGLQQLLDQPDLVVLIEDREIGFEADELGMAAQDARGQRMERAEPHRLDRIADNGADAAAHFGRRFVGERDCQNLVGKRLALDQQMHDARDQHARFARPRPCQHQKRPFGRGNGIALRRIERAQISRFGCQSSACIGRGWDQRLGRRIGQIFHRRRFTASKEVPQISQKPYRFLLCCF